MRPALKTTDPVPPCYVCKCTVNPILDWCTGCERYICSNCVDIHRHYARVSETTRIITGQSWTHNP